MLSADKQCLPQKQKMRLFFSGNCMLDIQVGDRVSVSWPRCELGVVAAIWGAYASVDFRDGTRHVPLAQLKSMDAHQRKRHEELTREEQRRQAEQDREKERQKAAVRQEALAKIRDVMNHDFLRVDEFYWSHLSAALPEDDFISEKALYARDWIVNSLTDYGMKFDPPDLEQATAIASVQGNVQVLARAGSGKTTTLVNRTLFLLKHCRVSPSEILLLAFNRKATMEIRKNLLLRLVPEARAELDKALAKARDHAMGRKQAAAEIEATAVEALAERFSGRLPHVMNFHALAYAIVHPEGQMLFDGTDGDSLGLSRAVQDVIDEFMQHPDSHNRIRDLMTNHFREDWDRIVAGGFNLDKDNLLALKRSMPRETLAGELVKSRGEKAIADFLFEHDIRYKYERNHWWSGVNYKPDFTIFKTEKSGVVVEYFGMAGDEKYDRLTEEKQQYWAGKEHWNLISLYPHDMAELDSGYFEKNLAPTLESYGIACCRLSEDEIWQRVKLRSIDRFSRAVTSFIGRCRKKSWTAADLARQIEAHATSTEVESKFLAIGSEVFEAYLERLAQTGDDDFDGLMQKAAKAIDSGTTAFLRRSGGGNIKALKFVCIDEFQDFSELFYRLVEAMRKANDRLAFFCVGDDWQAINGFAGSELRFFENFPAYFNEPSKLHIATNYRSKRQIVEVGNDLMKGLGTPARAFNQELGDVWVCDIVGFEPSFIEKQRHPGDLITPLVARLVYRFILDGKRVVLLGRRNGLPWYFKNEGDEGSGRGLDDFLRCVRSCLPKDMRDMVSISTAHKYKGLEKPAVIILDAVARSYPLIHPDWPFSRIFGDTPVGIARDERRLFYVALTRAIDSLVIVTDPSTRSPFLEEVSSLRMLNPLSWKAFPPASDGSNRRLLLKVKDVNGKKFGPNSGTFPIKDLLYACRYHFHGVARLWEKSVVQETFDLDAIQAESWALAASEVEAMFFDEFETLLASYQVNHGQWIVKVDQWHLMTPSVPI
jgi:DNA helicase IV